MTADELANLQPGDIVQNHATGQGWLVMANYGELGVIVGHADLIKNPTEWGLFHKREFPDSAEFPDSENGERIRK